MVFTLIHGLMLLLLWIGLASQVLAQPQELSPIRLEANGMSISREGRTQWLEDRDGTLSPTQALTAPGWQTLRGELNFGFTRSAIWLHLKVERVSDAEQWRIEVNNALFKEVRLYSQGTDGDWQEQRAGRAIAHSQWPLQTRSPVFALNLPKGTHTLLLRVESVNALSAAIRLWEAERFQAAALREYMGWGVYFGLYGLVILIQLLFWSWTRETLSGWYVPYALSNFIGMLFTPGFPQNALDVDMTLANYILGLSICIALAVGTKFSLLQLELDKAMPRLSRILASTASLITMITSALVLSGRYGLGVSVAQLASLAWMTLTAGIAGALMFRGHRPARWFLTAFSIFYIGIGIRYLRNLGVLEPSALTDYSVQVGSIVHMVVMCLFIVYRYNTLKMALQIEQKARREQREFVAMVSHEYRTPLAIIARSSEQLAANLDAAPEKSLSRCTNIQTAVKRMEDLLDKHLSAERLDEDTQQIQRSRWNPLDLLEDLAADWPEQRISLVLDALPTQIDGDRGLIEVALRNLLTNADRHAQPGSVIEVNAKMMSGQQLSISVTNQGDTVPDDELPHLFKKYFRGRQSRLQAGAGLGLFIVLRVAQLHGGSVQVTSEAGVTRFMLLLPVAA